MNISNTRDCFGCGVCAIACAKHIISIELNAEGFYEPRITEPDKCTNCGLCMEVCSCNHDDLALKTPILKPYAAWSKDQVIRRKCSSGGVGFEVGRSVISEGGKVCGVRYNAEKNQAEHYVASSDQELIPSIGSKYIQSYTVDGFTEIVRLMKESRKKGENTRFLITGTPCQIDSFRRWAQRFKFEDQCVFLDFFCHGVPSKLMWNKYVLYVEKKVGKLTYVSWRNKFTGWHDSWAMHIKGVEGEMKTWRSKDDVFYRLFLSDACLGKQCYEKCRFKYNHSSADIRIGDAWGEYYKKDQDGVSTAIAFSEIGHKYLKACNCNLIEHPMAIVSEGQMRSNPQHRWFFPLIKGTLSSPIDISYSFSLYKLCVKINRKLKKFGFLK